jgi:hypothetical protein
MGLSNPSAWAFRCSGAELCQDPAAFMPFATYGQDVCGNAPGQFASRAECADHGSWVSDVGLSCCSDGYTNPKSRSCRAQINAPTLLVCVWARTYGVTARDTHIGTHAYACVHMRACACVYLCAPSACWSAPMEYGSDRAKLAWRTPIELAWRTRKLIWGSVPQSC